MKTPRLSSRAQCEQTGASQSLHILASKWALAWSVRISLVTFLLERVHVLFPNRALVWGVPTFFHIHLFRGTLPTNGARAAFSRFVFGFPGFLSCFCGSPFSVVIVVVVVGDPQAGAMQIILFANQECCAPNNLPPLLWPSMLLHHVMTSHDISSYFMI